MTISEAIHHLKNYSGPLELTLHEGAPEWLIEKVESAYGIILPDDFKTFYRFSDGFETLEDIFNMIPLAEIIDNQKNSKAFSIAEYMIYSDTWDLEIDPVDRNKYEIVNTGFDNKKVLLTNSLAEFIQGVLKDGVHGEGGLYYMLERGSYRYTYPIKPENISALLQVLYEGLIHDIITREEVTAWADEIILLEDEPHYFFIDVSLSSDENKLLAVLAEYVAHLDLTPIVVRALFGLLYHKVENGSVVPDKAFQFIWDYEYTGHLTSFENDMLGKCDENLSIDNIQGNSTNTLLEILAYYKEFKLSNYEQWGGINWRIEVDIFAKSKEMGFDDHNIKLNAVNETQNNKGSKRTLIIKIFLCLINAISDYNKWV